MYRHNRSDDTDIFVLLYFSQHNQPCLAMRNWTLQSGSFSVGFPRRVATYLRQRAGNFLQSSRAEVLNSRRSSGNGWFNKCTSVLNIFDRPVRGPKRGQNEVNTRPDLCPQNREVAARPAISPRQPDQHHRSGYVEERDAKPF